MRKLFLIIVSVLVIASVCTVASRKQEDSTGPVLSWKTGICPERHAQVELFRRWMVREGYVDKDGQPLFDVKLEAESIQSTMIQAVSGVGADILDRVPVNRYAPMGVLEDITDFAEKNGLAPSDGYPGAASLITWNGRQYGYPCNLAVHALWSNVELFEKYGMAPPPVQWTPEEFERIGKEFTRRANQGKERMEIFFCAWTPMTSLIARSRGRDVFNETLTAADIANPVFAEILRLHYKWVFEDRLMPSNADRASENAEGSFGGNGVSLFIYGRYAMICTARYVHMNLRPLNRKIRTANSLFPQYDFRNAVIAARISGVYSGGKHKEYAKIFLKFLASREYNDLLIAGADGLPPNPRIAMNNPEYASPAAFPLEGNTHANELEWANTVALPEPASPYFPQEKTGIDNALDKVMNNIASPEEALRDEEFRINRLIAEVVAGNPALKRQYDADIELQKKIDEYKRTGEKIPKSWIRNPFYLAYYRSSGQLDEER